MKPGSHNRAFTLIEVSIYSAVLLLLMGGVYSVVVGGFRYLRLAQAQETVNQQALVGMRRMTTLLEGGSQSNLVIGGAVDDQHIIFLSLSGPEPADPDVLTFTGVLPNWQKWVCFYKNAQDQLVRAELPVGTPGPDPLAHAAPTFAGDILPLDAQPIAQNVFRLNFNYATPPQVAIELETKVDTNSGTVTNPTSTNLRMEASATLLNP